MYAERLKAGDELSVRTKFILEIGVPSFSVMALLGVTGYISSDAIEVIYSNGSEDDVNIYFLFGFAAANFFVDIVSSYMFYVRRHEIFLDQALMDENTSMTTSTKSNKNLNMISAFTHVGGDTMRTFAVFFAALISSVTSASGSICDAWAAVVVSGTIILCVLPLIKEIYIKFQDFVATDGVKDGGEGGKDGMNLSVSDRC